MTEVSARAFTYFRHARAAEVVDLEALLSGLGVRPSDFDDDTRAMPWDTWIELCERMARALGSDERLVRSAHFALDLATSLELARVASLLGTWFDAYRFAFEWAAVGLFRAAKFEVTPVASTNELVHLDVRSSIDGAHRASRAWMLLVEGALAVLPRAFGHADATVERRALDERASEWRVTVPNVLLRPIDPPSSASAPRALAHEINNPLTYIVTNVWLVREVFERMPPSEQRTEMLHVLDELDAGARRIRDAVVRAALP